MTESAESKDVVRDAGRGVVWISFAKMWFMVTGWILVLGLPRIFKWASGGDAEEGQSLYGVYKLVVMGVSFINNAVVTGTIQTVSKFTSEDESKAGPVLRTALKVQGLLGLAIAVLYIASAGLIADLLGSPDLAFLMRLTAGIIVAYSCYAAFIGSFNGRRLFGRQAAFDIAYSTVRTTLIVGLAVAGLEVLGTVVGFLAAAFIIAIAAAAMSRLSGTGSFPARRYLSFGSLLILYTFMLNLVLSVDLFLLKGIASSQALAAGQSAEAASKLGEMLAGQYGAAQGLAFIPYQSILAIAFVAFPMISQVTFLRDQAKTQDYVRKTMRFAAIFIVALAAVFGALPERALALVFPSEYKVAGPALGMLSLGIVFYGLMLVANTILNGAGKALQTLVLVSVTVVAVASGAGGLVSAAGPTSSALLAAATGSTIGMGLGLVLSGIAVWRHFGAFWPWLTALRVAVAATVAVLAGRFSPDMGKLVSLAECALVVVVYFAVLLVLREFTKEDREQLGRILKRRKAAS